MQFAPRMRDLGDQRLDRFDSEATYRHLAPLLSGKIGKRRILEHRDDLPRVVGSLKRGHVAASLRIGKLHATPRATERAEGGHRAGAASLAPRHGATRCNMISVPASGLNSVGRVGPSGFAAGS